MREIPLTKGLVALVDDEDYDWLMQWPWHAASGGRYAARRLGKAENPAKPILYMHCGWEGSTRRSRLPVHTMLLRWNISESLRALITPTRRPSMGLTESGNPDTLISFDVTYMTEVVELNPFKKPSPRHTGHDTVQKGLVCAMVFARSVEDAIVRIGAGAPVKFPVMEIAAITQSPPLPDGGARTSESVIGLPTTALVAAGVEVEH